MQRLAYVLWLCATPLCFSACGGGTTAPVPSRINAFAYSPGSYTSPIAHIVVIVQENRTFNNLFATFPGATGTTVGKKLYGKGKNQRTVSVKLMETSLRARLSLNHAYLAFLQAYDGGNMDGFNRVKFVNDRGAEGRLPYHYVNPSQIVPYWTMAKEYALANAMFDTQGSDSFPAHQDLIRGGTEVSSSQSMIDGLPYSHGAWGCDSPPGTKTSVITTGLRLRRFAGPFPCTSDFPSSGSDYETLRDLLDAKSLSWKYYTPKLYDPGGIWDAFDVIAPVRYGPEWGTNVSWPETNIFNDIAKGALPAVSWVIPEGKNSDHPRDGSDTGPSWVASVVNAVGESPDWNSSAIIVLWDDWGGFYDPVKPPPFDKQGGPGFRVPMIVVSPYARKGPSNRSGYISNTVYEFGSIVQFIEDTFNLGRLGTTDSTTNSMSDMFDFYQPPRPFKTIGSKYSRAYFLHQKPSGLPVDTE
ncbi:MAG: alkaline phosphatase family protein [Candidatus Cybelea sp.]